MPRVKQKENIPLQFASLYVHGPKGIRGNWEACERQIGKKVSNIQEVREAILAEGGSLGEVDKMPPAPEEFGIGEDVLDLSKYTEVSEDADENEWKKLAKELESTIREVAKGEIKASAAQIAIIKHVLERAYGRIGQKDDSVAAAGVIILPALGERSEMFICPVCSTRIEKLHPRKEE